MTCPAEADTALLDLTVWEEPVETPASLPTHRPDGQLCFVKSEDRTYVVRGGAWVPFSTVRKLAS